MVALPLAAIRTYTGIMDAVIVQIRQASPKDAPAIAAIHEEAWRSSYQGIIPHLALERMIARRGPGWWQQSLAHDPGVLIFVFDGLPQGYVTFGRARSAKPWQDGEIYELYLTPTYQGVGFGKRLFGAARKVLESQGHYGLVVWALEDNESACAFYSNQGGKVTAAAPERFGKVTLRRIAFAWPPLSRS